MISKENRMPLPINLPQLLHGSTVEWERIEFKEGWNPEIILHTICAFANDINNWGGGYLIIGIADSNGRAIIPPNRLDIDELDGIQQELHKLCHKLTPNYFPVVEPYEIEGKHILVVWVPGGDNRPYKAPKHLGKNAEKFYYVRRMSSTARANTQEEQQLIQLASKIPFDDRVNHHATIDDLSLAEIRMFLQDVKSDLFSESETMPFEELVRLMQIARGASEYLLPVNVGLLFFSEEPEKFFPYTQIEVNIYHDDIGDNFTERIFRGAIHQQLRKALSFIKTQVIEEHIRKVTGQAEAIRFYNYPFEALEEALANAIYHKNYELREPIEVNIRLDRIEILSHAGPMPPITQDDLTKERIVSRKYLNRRVGDLLKELRLTEGKGTGIPKIRRAMKNNGSKEPMFETDNERSYFMTTLFKQNNIHHEGLTTPQVTPHVKKLLKILDKEMSRAKIMELLEIKDRKYLVQKYLKPAIDKGYIELTIANKPTSKNQKYRLTEHGKKNLEE
jgi:ATP-dependent DNA helicase RecG